MLYNLIKEEYKRIHIKQQIINENKVTDHFEMRLGQRVFCDLKHKCEYTSISKLPEKTKKEIVDNIKFLESIDYIPKKTMSVILYEFPEDHYAKYFDYKETEKDHIRKGDVLWVVMRDGELITIILGDYKIPENTHIKIHINDLKEYMSNKKRKIISKDDIDKIKHPEKYKTEKKEKDENIKLFKIDGIKWVIDKNNEQIYKKNKPQNKYNLFDFIEQINKKDEELSDRILELAIS